RVPSAGALAAPVVVLTGVGEVRGNRPVAPETLRRAAGAAVRSLAGPATVALALPAGHAASVGAVAEGALLGAYAFDRYRTSPSAADKAPVRALTLLTSSGRAADVRAAVQRAEVLADAVKAARDLVNTAPVDLYPAEFADRAVAAVEGL